MGREQTRYKHRTALLMAFLFTTISSPGFATNGTNALAFSPEAFGVGGADIGFIRDTAAVAVNPANLEQISTARIDWGIGVTEAGSIRHSDSFNNSQTQGNTPIPFATFGYAKRISPNTVMGVALVGQGGVGVEYEGLNTAFGTKDKLENTLRIAKFSAGLSRKVSNSLFLGASLEIIYSDLEQSFFPNTSVVDPNNSANSFFGYEIDKADTLTAGIRLGLRYQPTERTSIGIAYVTPMDLEFDNVRYVSDMSAMGLEKVRYEADITNQKQPQELGIGIAVQASDKLSLVAEVNWINWSNAFNRPKLTATKPDNPLAPPVIATELIQEWDDQYVFSAGAVYAADNNITWRVGINYAKNPIPDKNLLPLFPLIGERHAALGIGYELPGGWHWDGAYIRSFPNSVNYSNPNAPFGPDAEETFSLWHLMATLTYVWEN